MSKGKRDENLAQHDDYLDEDSDDWSEAVVDGASPNRDKSTGRSAPKWKAIEEYWEKKRLEDALQDYLSEDK
ncbi:MAG: hypothetical protein P8173_01750 [Gammaproteobacteria bacterium]